jgi:hypothetical protein
MKTRPVTTRRAVLACLTMVAAALVCGGLIAAAALLSAPPVVLPAIVALCIACPAIAAHELPASLATLRRARFSKRASRELSRLRQELDRLPEVEHPLGL